MRLGESDRSVPSAIVQDPFELCIITLKQSSSNPTFLQVLGWFTEVVFVVLPSFCFTKQSLWLITQSLWLITQSDTRFFSSLKQMRGWQFDHHSCYSFLIRRTYLYVCFNEASSEFQVCTVYI